MALIKREIDLVTVFDAILTSGQTRDKLQRLYENLMWNNFRKTAALKKNINCKLKLHSLGFYWKNSRALHALEDLEPFFKIFYTFVCKNFPGKTADKYMENLKQTSGAM